MSMDRHGRLALEVLRAGGRSHTVADVLAATAQPAEAPPAATDPPDLDAALAEYRYARDLISAEECDQWLALRGLAYPDLVAHLQRRAGGLPATDPDEALADALLDASFESRARQLARQIALVCEHGEAGARDWLAQPCDPGECRRELENQGQAWTRLVGVLVEFDDAPAAREARACVEADGEDLVELARAQGFAWRHFDAQAGSLPAPIGAALAHAPVGALRSALLDDGRHCLLRLASREAPRLEDPQVAARIDAALRARTLDALVCRHVHWVLPLQLA